MSVGANIRKRRVQLKISQQELADIMGYKTRSTIAKIESGENDVSQTKLRKFAAALNTTVEALIAEASEVLHMPAVSEITADRKHQNIAVILAGGDAGKNRQNIPTQFLNVCGKPILVYCMEAYQEHPAIDGIYVACLKGWESIVTAYAKQYGITKLKGIVPGGDSGMASLKNAVEHIKDHYNAEDLLVIQEATRPRVSAETISKLLLATAEKGSATICHRMDEYVQFRMTGTKAEYIDRNAMIALQSPEAHCLSLITEVFEKAAGEQAIQESCFTMLLYKLGYDIHFVEGSINNIKLTQEEDITAFAALVR